MPEEQPAEEEDIAHVAERELLAAVVAVVAALQGLGLLLAMVPLASWAQQLGLRAQVRQEAAEVVVAAAAAALHEAAQVLPPEPELEACAAVEVVVDVLVEVLVELLVDATAAPATAELVVELAVHAMVLEAVDEDELAPLEDVGHAEEVE